MFSEETLEQYGTPQTESMVTGDTPVLTSVYIWFIKSVETVSILGNHSLSATPFHQFETNERPTKSSQPLSSDSLLHILWGMPGLGWTFREAMSK